LKGFQELRFTYEALQIWLKALQIERCRETTVPVTEAFNRIATEDIVAQEDLPRFDRSAVDGYAVNAEDTSGASQFKPLLFKLSEKDEIEPTGPRNARQVWTGNPIPKGANAVVMLEHTTKKNDKIEISTQAAPYSNVSRKGEDLKKGETAVKAGTRLNPYHLGLLTALGYAEIKVTEKPKIAIFATGNELAETGKPRSEKQIYESNRVALSAMCMELDAEPLDLGIVQDDVDEIVEKIQLALKIADAVITTGGTSVGGLDLVPEAVNKTGKPGIIVHGIAMRPGMPTALAVINGKPVVVLSGNPVAAVVGFELFARPLISRMLGMEKEEARPTVKATLTRKVATALGRKTFVRVKVFEKNGELLAEPVSARGSGAISTMTRGNGFVIVPENREGVVEGETVTVRLFGNVEVASEDV
jgi:molybdopterin molybdotransferase